MTDTAKPPQGPVWTPTAEQVEATHLHRFMRIAEERCGVPAGDYEALWRFSIDDREAFWDLVRKDARLKAESWGRTGNERVLLDGDRMPGARWYPDARLNYAENLLCRHDDAEAMVFRGEDKVARELTWNELHDEVSRLQQALREAGVKDGDRVAARRQHVLEGGRVRAVSASPKLDLEIGVTA